MKRIQWIGMGILSLSLAGCVPMEKYNVMKMERDRAVSQLSEAQSASSTARAEADLLKQQLAATNSGSISRDGLVNNLNTRNAQLEAELADLNRRYQEALSRRGESVALPAALSNELQQFANANPDLVEFDAARGIVKFKSDVTFATGSADLTDKARTAIQRFSAILNSPTASAYELIVAGHTDNAPVVNPATKQRGHLNNWYLSAHRAISVAEALRVDGRRLGVTGYADNRPVASNTSESGKAQNRRVEVLILPTTASLAGKAPAAPAPRMTTPRPAMNKDTAVAPQQPVLNK